MVEISSPLSRENRIQISRSSNISGLVGDRASILAQNPIVAQRSSGPDPETLKALEANQNSLNIVSSGIVSLRQRLDILSSSLSSLSSVITNNTILENFRENQRADQDRRLAEQALRDESEAAIERKIQSSIGKPVQNIAQNTTSKLNSLMGAFSKLFFGWLGFQGISSIQSQIFGNSKKLSFVKETLSNSLNTVKNVLLGIRNGFDDIASKLVGITSRVTKVVAGGLIINPFKALFPNQSAAAKAGSEATEAVTKAGTSAAADAGTKAGAEAVEAATKAGTSAAADATTKAGTEAAEAATKGGLGKSASRFLPFLNIPVGAYFAQQNLKEGDVLGAGFDVGGMIPGPLGWASLGGGLLYETMTKGGIKGVPNMSDIFKNQPQNPTPAPTPTATPSTEPQKTSSNATSSENNLVASSTEQMPIISPSQISSQSEDIADKVTPTGNLAFNFGEQITNINNKVFSSSNEENDNLAMNIPSVLGMKEESKTEDFNYSDYLESSKEKPSIDSIQKSSPIVESIPKKESSIGPTPRSQPNIIVTPIPQPQQSPQRSSGSSGPASDVPAIPSSNPDNFYALYSKVHYNIV